MDLMLHELQPGMIVSEDIYHDNGTLIIGVGTVLTMQMIERLDELMILSVSIMKSEVANTPDPIVIKQAQVQATYNKTVDRFKSIYKALKYGRHVIVDQVQEMVTPLVDEVLNNTGLVKQLWQLQSCDEYTFDHSVTVSLVSALLAKWMGYTEAQLKEIAIAGMMHDLGKMNIPDEILNKPTALTKEEFSVMKTHATLGYMLLMQQKGFSDEVLKVAIEHHERYDGKGYPNGLKGKDIHIFARIVTIADMFSAMTTDRIYRKAVNPFKVAEVMKSEAYGYLDPFITTLFINHISNFYVGNVVRLNNGEVGEVVLINKHMPYRPLVHTASGFIDLAKDFDIEIEALIN